MTATILRPQLRQALLRQLHNNTKRKRNILQQGFTLVELMIVIVIVGILSAVALPNFLNQTSKAKATECATKAGAILSQVGAEHLISPADAAALLTAELTTANANSTECAFTKDTTVTAPEYRIDITGAVGGTLVDKYDAIACINGETGVRKTAATYTGTAPSPAPTCS